MKGLSLSHSPAISVREAAAELDHEAVLVLDVREREEFCSGHIGAARHLPLGSFNPAELTRDARYLVVCHSGARSALATRRLRAAGLEAVNLRGGMRAWHRAGRPVSTEHGHGVR